MFSDEFNRKQKDAANNAHGYKSRTSEGGAKIVLQIDLAFTEVKFVHAIGWEETNTANRNKLN